MPKYEHKEGGRRFWAPSEEDPSEPIELTESGVHFGLGRKKGPTREEQIAEIIVHLAENPTTSEDLPVPKNVDYPTPTPRNVAFLQWGDGHFPDKPSILGGKKPQTRDTGKLMEVYIDVPGTAVVEFLKDNDLVCLWSRAGAQHQWVPVHAGIIEHEEVLHVPSTLALSTGNYDLTFDFLKSCFRALGMSGFSSKSKEQLLDEVLERMTADAQAYPMTDKKPMIVTDDKRGRSYPSRYDNPKPGEEPKANLEAYREQVAVASRVVGESIFMPGAAADCDVRVLNRSYRLVRPVDIFDGVDKFLKYVDDLAGAKVPEKDDED
jgi:hypothetical protein